MNLQTGAFGDQTMTETLILFWAKMEELHYPGAGTTKKFLEEKLERERQQAAAAQEQQQAMIQAQAAQQQAAAVRQGGGQLPDGIAQAIDERARQDAMAAVQGGQSGFGM